MLFPFFFDPTIILLLPALFLAFWAQMKVKGAYAEYSRVATTRGIRAQEAARMILDSFGLRNVAIEPVPGNLTDHYDPRSKTLRLSEGVYNSPSIAAIGIAAHEAGHALQDMDGYAPLRLRNMVVPVANLGSGLAFPLFFIGFLFGSPTMMDIGILFFIGVLVFHLVTLPVEFNASGRAIKVLAGTGMFTQDELHGAKKVLDAAALTYVAATVMAAMQLLRLIMLRGMRSD
ncbi:zinc metallopeptidase [Thermovirga sp.]|uniref:zinc metallopeptidase n=1 Tax=Thermovirga sp. TaxID=2699834 RepID=UPI0025E9181C|nr:zinc metallopeptidase [Thermovirga sp.]MBO8153773.1 zinc metallopeptidase [Thermovirga sp.]